MRPESRVAAEADAFVRGNKPTEQHLSVPNRTEVASAVPQQTDYNWRKEPENIVFAMDAIFRSFNK